MKRSRNALRRMAAGIAMAAAIAWTGLAETVTNVRGIQRENSKLVDIYYDLNATDYGTYTVGVEIEGRTIAVTASTFTGDVGEGVTPGTNRHILWDAGTDWPNKKGDVRAIVTATKEDPSVSHGKVQLWEGGPYWADRNIGASAPEDYGLYFWWGDTTGYRLTGTTFNFNFCEANTPTWQKDDDTLQSWGWLMADGVLALTHDAAHVHWGSAWRMPTHLDAEYLSQKCDWTWTTQNGVKGYIVRGRGTYASNSIFLPAASYGYETSLYDYPKGHGYYWLSNPSFDSDYAYHLHFNYVNAGSAANLGGGYRNLGFPIRPVQGFTN